jgi:hypothetical protein
MTTFKTTSSVRALGEKKIESKAELFALWRRSSLSATQPK